MAAAHSFICRFCHFCFFNLAGKSNWHFSLVLSLCEAKKHFAVTFETSVTTYLSAFSEVYYTNLD
jgi:hypothetical protein